MCHQGFCRELCGVALNKSYPYGAEYKIFAENIIDTTSDTALSAVIGVAPEAFTHTLNAAVTPADPEGKAGRMKSDVFEVCLGRFDDEYIASFGFDCDDKTARAHLLEYVISKQKPFSEWRIISVAEESEASSTAAAAWISEGLVRDTSVSQPDAISAFDAGMKLAGALLNKTVPDRKRNRRPQNIIRHKERYDVIVAGLGTAGAMCALTAARGGLQVLGLEQWNSMGGVGTLGAIATQ